MDSILYLLPAVSRRRGLKVGGLDAPESYSWSSSVAALEL